MNEFDQTFIRGFEGDINTWNRDQLINRVKYLNFINVGLTKEVDFMRNQLIKVCDVARAYKVHNQGLSEPSDSAPLANQSI